MATAMKFCRQIRVDGKRIRGVSKTTSLSRNTLRKDLREDDPQRYDLNHPRPKRCLKAFEGMLQQWYKYDLKRPKRERRTAKGLYEQWILEGYQGSYSPVCRVMQHMKQRQDTTHEAFVLLHFEAGDALQFDWS